MSARVNLRNVSVNNQHNICTVGHITHRPTSLHLLLHQRQWTYAVNTYLIFLFCIYSSSHLNYQACDVKLFDTHLLKYESPSSQLLRTNSSYVMARLDDGSSVFAGLWVWNVLLTSPSLVCFRSLLNAHVWLKLLCVATFFVFACKSERRNM